MTRSAGHCSSDPTIVVANPDEDVNAEDFIAWLDNRQKGTPIERSVSAAETLAEIRAYGEQ
ncbi:MAG TPA: hypothetical protein VNG12_17235 [Acidimicrobiales bacterium]|nr:hypothetical protein [Acidimicrobiales bacterium]